MESRTTFQLVYTPHPQNSLHTIRIQIRRPYAPNTPLVHCQRRKHVVRPILKPAARPCSKNDQAYFQDVGGRLYPVDPELPIFLPQDQQETHRLDREHVALKLVLGCNYVGPVTSHLRHDPLSPRKRVLDIGTQQGTWLVYICCF